MKRTATRLLAALLLAATGAAHAVTEYNTVPAGDPQYRQCLSLAARMYEGGKEKSPIRGQTKEQAWCTCMWNETPEEFTGNLVKFSESAKGKRTNKLCEVYADWSE